MGDSVHRQVARPPAERPLMVFDGECSFCRKWIARWQRVTGPRVDYAPSSDVAARFPEIPASAFAEAVQLVEPDGTVSSGAEAALRSIRHRLTGRFLLGMYSRVPGAARILEAAYRTIARSRECLIRR